MVGAFSVGLRRLLFPRETERCASMGWEVGLLRRPTTSPPPPPRKLSGFGGSETFRFWGGGNKVETVSVRISRRCYSSFVLLAGCCCFSSGLFFLLFCGVRGDNGRHWGDRRGTGSWDFCFRYQKKRSGDQDRSHASRILHRQGFASCVGQFEV